MATELHKVKHNYLRYANCWEDAALLATALNPEKGDRILSIASAGDNSFALLLGDVERVFAVDINEVQLHLVELKKASIRSLSHEAFLCFLGFRPCETRWELFQQLKSTLPPKSADFWESKRAQIERGVIHTGKFENYFALFRKYVLPLVHSKKTTELLFTKRNKEDQQRFFDSKWNSWKWRMLFKLFFSKFVMGRFGRDPAFLKEVKIPVSEFILGQAKMHLSSERCHANYFLRYIMTGEFGEFLPLYARKENFELIRSRIDRLTIHLGLAESLFETESNLTKFNLSNIFEYLDDSTFQQVASNLIANGAPNAKFAYWNLMVPRRISAILDDLTWNEQQSNSLTQQDLCFFYKQIVVESKS